MLCGIFVSSSHRCNKRNLLSLEITLIDTLWRLVFRDAYIPSGDLLRLETNYMCGHHLQLQIETALLYTPLPFAAQIAMHSNVWNIQDDDAPGVSYRVIIDADDPPRVTFWKDLAGRGLRRLGRLLRRLVPVAGRREVIWF
jgi:hypothetical protein